MLFPLEFNDVIIWLILTCITLLVTSELLDPSLGQTNVIVERGRIKKVTYIIIILLIPLVLIKAYEIIITRGRA